MERDGEDKMKAVVQSPTGFRFHPTDEELVTRYLCRKCSSRPIPVPIIAEVDLYKYDPWQLPEMALYGEEEWYFFSPKATGRNKAIGPVGRKTILVFYSGKLPKAEKTNWVMHEYSLVDVETSNRNQNNSMLDDWVLCRIHKKTGAVSNKRKTTSSGLLRESSAQPQASWASPAKVNDRVYLGPSGSVPKLLTDSSYSEQVALPEFKEEESYLHSNGEKIVGYPFNYMGATEPTERQELLMWLDNGYKTWMI